MTSMPEPVDERLLGASDLARAALLEVTSEASIGEPVGYLDEGDGVISLRFANRLAGYPGWFWTVSVARVEDAEPTVLEVELLPGDDALVAPEWVPWAVRLAEYQATARASAESGESDLDERDDSDELDDDEIDEVLGDDLDDDELDDDGSPILHAGDLDGVDIDELDPAASDEDDDSDDEDDDDSDEDDDSDDDDDSDEDSDDDSDSEDED
ncbi:MULTISPECIES: DUF3027 domain-containing protein [Microbacterium]|uniref:DUF3027 domain-containing protein n=1 Tax=Microbacterium wangchenii TaxID=2541726 RepID=A0ABX5SWI7_9MICO|nr:MULTISPECIES: DUF3027 domain-containing protein [Microbacterium]MCK6067563.1 DUF3027 domain-containing protein [Microbacterium sp. EYE_512]QBR89512.1 DUF3027 domain-containing protein [Microbacterium wangchenii]TXK16890.1 DUF3027 domain-containing protein [Microbacterium wangchenii]